MKTTLYVLMFLFIGANFIACTPEALSELEQTESTTLGEDENDPEDEEDPGN